MIGGDHTVPINSASEINLDPAHKFTLSEHLELAQDDVEKKP
jgi:hypothetical protein